MPSRACTAGSRCSNHRNLEPALKPECREFVVIGESVLLLLVIMLVLLLVIMPMFILPPRDYPTCCEVLLVKLI